MSNVFISGNQQSTEALAVINNHNFIAENVSAWNVTTHGVYIQGAITPTLSNILGLVGVANLLLHDWVRFFRCDFHAIRGAHVLVSSY
jgi:hypothetical protein